MSVMDADALRAVHYVVARTALSTGEALRVVRAAHRLGGDLDAEQLAAAADLIRLDLHDQAQVFADAATRLRQRSDVPAQPRTEEHR